MRKLRRFWLDVLANAVGTILASVVVRMLNL